MDPFSVTLLVYADYTKAESPSTADFAVSTLSFFLGSDLTGELTAPLLLLFLALLSVKDLYAAFPMPSAAKV